MDVGDNPFIKNRPSTRVKYAPGGDSQLSFGNYDKKADDEQAARKNNQRDARQEKQRDAQLSSQVNVGSGNKNEPNDGAKAAGNIDSGRTAAQNEKRTNVKVNQPPGGASSIMFG